MDWIDSSDSLFEVISMAHLTDPWFNYVFLLLAYQITIVVDAMNGCILAITALASMLSFPTSATPDFPS